MKASGTDATDAAGVPLHRNPYWSIVRRIAGLENKADISLSDAVTDLLVRQKLIAVGRAYSPDATIDRPMSHEEIIAKIDRFCGEDIRDRVLSQEILIDLGVMIKTVPHRFKGFLTLRVNYFILLLTSQLAREQILTQDEAYEALMELSPFEIKTRLRQVIDGYQGATQALQRQESLHLQQPQQAIQWVLDAQQEDAKPPAGSWMRQRELDGTLNRVPKNFYQNVWTVLEHCRGLVIGDKLERRNRLDSGWLLAEMTPGEKNFALQVEHLLNKIEAPTYRQVCIEALIELAALTERNPELHVADYLVLDVLIGHAVRLAWVDRHSDQEQAYAERKAQAWQQFYEMSPYACASYIVRAFQFLLEMGAAAEEGDDAQVPETVEIEAAR
jgi:phosphorylase kinase alpha/beta subunit